ncbi:MAG: ABC transporter ATP-binding protein [Candidatus Xenobia bacterium]
MIDLQGLTKVYRRGRQELRALDGLNLQVTEGSVYGLVGPNGAGKSTTIKILAGLLAPTAGSARLGGIGCPKPESRASLGYLPETPVFHDFLTVEEVLDLHATLSDLVSAPIQESLERVGLAARRHSRVRELSKGMQQRLGLAQALLGSPKILLLDEPMSGLDPRAQHEVREILLGLKAGGLTMFISSHQLNDMETLCDRIGVMLGGRLVADRPLSDLMAQAGGTLLEVPPGDAERAVKLLRESGLQVVMRPGRGRLEEVYLELVDQAS